jgi:hypothetical protein
MHFAICASRRTAALAGFAALAVLVFAVPAARADFGFDELRVSFTEEDGSAPAAAGSHPFAWTVGLGLNTVLDPVFGEVSDQDVKDLRIVLPPGLVGAPALLLRCSQDDFSADSCAAETAVGSIALKTNSHEADGDVFPVYNLEPPYGSPAELGFMAVHVPVKIRIGIGPDPPHNLVASIVNAPQAAAFSSATLTLRGVTGGKPFLTLPRSCGGPPASVFAADSWQQPGTWTSATVVEADDGSGSPLRLSGCEELPFEPEVDVGPTSAARQAPSGLSFSLDAPVEGLESPTERADADVGAIDLALPEGMAVNASVAAGLLACTPAAYARETPTAAPGEGCPEASKVGTTEVVTPLLDEPVAGSLYVAQPDDPATAAPGAENPFDTMLALYVVLENPRLGVLVKQAMRVEADPASGRLTASIDDLPQLPLSHLELRLRGGERSPFVTPSACGHYAIGYSLDPSSGAAALSGEDSFGVDQGCGAAEFKPTLSAGVTEPRAGAASPFVLRLGQGDGEQNPSRVALTLPKGLSADFGAVSRCPESLAAQGACPADSRIGSARIAAGAGAIPVWIPAAAAPPGAVYLAGPYRGAPFGLAIVVPARAGPFDLGTVVVRAAVSIDPRTAQAKIDLDPLPQILDGIPIAYRELRLTVDRPGFVLNPTGCAPRTVDAAVTSTTGTAAAAADRFRVGGCSRLRFAPRVSLRLAGPTHRGAHPEVRATVTARGGDANIRRAVLGLPVTELLDTRHIGTVCTRVEFAARRCPRGSVYGFARAWTPLLDRPLEGPVYLRASDHQLPDLVAALDGQVQLDLAARVDAVRGRLRTTFAAMPDVPFRKFSLTMYGGERGLFANSGGLCAQRRRAKAAFVAHNLKRRLANPVVKTDCRDRSRRK